MTASTIGWGSTVSNTGINLAWQSRSGGPQSRLTIGFAGADPQGIALSGGTIAFTANNGDQRYDLYLQPADGSSAPTLAASTLGANNVVALPTGGFAVLNDPTPADPAIETVSTTGAFTTFSSLAPISAVPQQISLSGGRLAFEDGSDPPTSLGAALWSLPTTRAGTTVSLGTETLLGTDASTQILTSDDRTAYVADTTTAQKQLVVFDGSSEELSMPLASTTAVVAFSGDNLLLHTVSTSSWSVLNVDTGASTPVTTADAWIWGPYVYYQGTKGQILRLNLTQPTSATNPYQVRAGDGCGIEPGELLAWNTWVGFDCSNGAKLNYDEVINTSTHKVIPLTGDELTEMGDGAVAWYSGGVVYVMDLDSSAHTITAIGDLAPSPYPQLMALDSSGGQDVAWLAPDEQIHIAPIPVPAAKPALLDDLVATTMAPGGTWDASFDLSKPVSWTITIKNSGAKTVYKTAKTSATDGSIRSTWNGKSTTGTTELAGTYTWKLTTTGLDGIGSLSETGTLTIS